MLVFEDSPALQFGSARSHASRNLAASGGIADADRHGEQGSGQRAVRVPADHWLEARDCRSPRHHSSRLAVVVAVRHRRSDGPPSCCDSLDFDSQSRRPAHRCAVAGIFPARPLCRRAGGTCSSAIRSSAFAPTMPGTTRCLPMRCSPLTIRSRASSLPSTAHRSPSGLRIAAGETSAKGTLHICSRARAIG